MKPLFNQTVSTNKIELLSEFSLQNLEEVTRFHKTLPGYTPTPLHSLDSLASYLGVGQILVKDESQRLKLGAFKVLGASYAIAKYLSKHRHNDKALSFGSLVQKDVKGCQQKITFATTTDGNHGLGLAWVASQLGHKSIIYMPKGSSDYRVQRIEAAGGTVTVTDRNYDQTVQLTEKLAKENNWVIVQDTAWDGYESIPKWIMQGYATIMLEILAEIQRNKWDTPTHIVLQAGVGSFASSMLSVLANSCSARFPLTIIAEPNNANCFYQSIQNNMPTSVTGSLQTIMAGLSCGVPNPLAWTILGNLGDVFFSCPDTIAARGMRILGNPLPGDPAVVSGESGALGIGLLSHIVEDDRTLTNRLGINKQSRILIINTEGATDPAHYRKVVWDGAYSYIAKI